LTLQPATEVVRKEPRAGLALVTGILSVLLIWPLGILLGPAAVALGIAGLRRIRRANGTLTGSYMSIAGLTMGGVVCGLYLGALFLEIAALVLFGQMIPAAP